MTSNEQTILEWYSEKNEDLRATQSRADNLEFHFTKKAIDKYISSESNVIEIGCGTGFYGIYCADKCKKYTGVDLIPKNIEIFNEKVKSDNIQNIETMVGNITNLANIKDENFDIVLVLGPMYHLSPENRELAIIEAKRICKMGGIIFFAYINKLGAYLQSGILSFPEHYPNKIANECVLKNGMDDIHPGLFFYTTPLEMEEMAKRHGLNVIKNIGVNYVFNKKQINDMDEEKFNHWLEFSE